jgi:hypothetical protein
MIFDDMKKFLGTLLAPSAISASAGEPSSILFWGIDWCFLSY